jgi:hypothetical protein
MANGSVMPVISLGVSYKQPLRPTILDATLAWSVEKVATDGSAEIRPAGTPREAHRSGRDLAHRREVTKATRTVGYVCDCPG